MRSDRQYIEKALKLADDASESGNRPFGALLVANGEVVATKRSETVTGEEDIGHTELRLAQQAVRDLDRETRDRCTIYTSTEPCPMCAGAIYYAGLARVVFSVSGETFREITGIGGIDIPCSEVFDRAAEPAPSVTGPVLEQRGATLHREFEY